MDENIPKPAPVGDLVASNQSASPLVSTPLENPHSPGFLSRYALFFVVFITGACVLILEITATRVLTPYFGNTIFTISSVVTTILFALSVGYYVGGKLADRYCSFLLFYSIIFFSGVFVFILFFLNIFFLAQIAYGLNIIYGLLLSAMLLFFPASFLLAMLSPFVIKLQGINAEQNKLGEVSGNVFFWSTFGSIFGSLSSGFLLIPVFGVNHIIVGVGITLLGLGIVGMVFSTKKPVATVILIGIGILVVGSGFLALRIFPQSVEKVLYSQHGTYQKITIYDTMYQGKPARFFRQDRNFSGAMYLDSSELAFQYTKYYQLYKLFNPKIQNVLVLGGAPYTVPKALLENEPHVFIDVVEIEPRMLELGKKFFKVPTTTRLVNHVSDARRFVHDADKKYDLIFGDAFSSIASVPTHLTTKEYFELVKERLAPNGLFVANMGGTLSITPPSFLFSSIKTFKMVFPNSYFFAVINPAQTAPQNVMFAGFNSDRVIDFSSSEVKQHPDEFIRLASEKIINVDRYDLSVYKEFTDNYAPTDYLATKLELSLFLQQEKMFDARDALWLIHQQESFGPKTLGSEGHTKEQAFLKSALESLNKDVSFQEWRYLDTRGKSYQLKNMMTSVYPEKEKKILLATHYDGNDSGAGVAALLQVLQYLKDVETPPEVGVDFVFFDGEAGEAHSGLLGSTYFANDVHSTDSLGKPVLGIVVDIRCLKNSSFYQEENSLAFAPKQVAAFWNIAAENKYSRFVPQVKGRLLDAHVSLAQVGIPSFLLQDFAKPDSTEAKNSSCDKNVLHQAGSTIIKYIYSI